MANYVSYENAQALVQGINTKIDSKFAELGGAYIARGSRSFDDLPSTLTESMVGYVYNLTDEFETDARFVEGAGKTYSAGSNVVVVDAGSDGSHEYKLDVLGSFVDVERITAKIDDLDEYAQATRERIAPAFDADTSYAKGDVVWFDNRLYELTGADTFHDDFDHEAWTAVTVSGLISAAEPDSLTAAQMSSLLGILE